MTLLTFADRSSTFDGSSLGLGLRSDERASGVDLGACLARVQTVDVRLGCGPIQIDVTGSVCRLRKCPEASHCLTLGWNEAHRRISSLKSRRARRNGTRDIGGVDMWSIDGG